MNIEAFIAAGKSSPRTWGCFWLTLLGGPAPQVFPTHVGVFPPIRHLQSALQCLPHARGGVSNDGFNKCLAAQSSPRTWGCFSAYSSASGSSRVFPTHVGVFLSKRPISAAKRCLPHARGGVSNTDMLNNNARESSPRTWWCFLVHGLQFVRAGVFPTHVGVFPSSHATISQESSLAHTCGGVSYRR